MKKNAITINFENNEAVVTKAFAKAATIFGTEEYKMWKECREQNPGIKMTCKTIKKNPDKKSYKNLTYANMKLFIKLQTSEETDALLDELKKQIKQSKVQSNPYRAVLAWFLQKFPKYDEYKEFWAKVEAEAKAAKDAA